MARSLDNLATIDRDGGNLATAEAYLKSGLAIREKLGRPFLQGARGKRLLFGLSAPAYLPRIFHEQSGKRLSFNIGGFGFDQSMPRIGVYCQPIPFQAELLGRYRRG